MIESQLLICGLLWRIEVEVFETMSYLSSYCVTRLFVAGTLPFRVFSSVYGQFRLGGISVMQLFFSSDRLNSGT